VERRSSRRDRTLIVPPTVEFTQSRPHLEARTMSPTDGSVAQSEGHVSVYCAPCHRWIDCYVNIEPETALSRHVRLVHLDEG
jgi:hypothetical protein